MELKFIWIKKYGLLNNLGANFNHADNIFFEYDGKRLNTTHRNPKILNFGPKISGVTAIAGQNGSGKSSLCQIVLNSTATYTEGVFGYDMTFDGIVCYDKFIFYHESLTIDNLERLQEEGYRVEKYSQSPFENVDMERRELTAGGFIYYSNLFDFSASFDVVNLKNISTMSLLYEEAGYSTAYSRYTGDSGKHIPKDQRSELRIFQLGQGYKNIKYYLEYYDTIPFSGPDYIILKSAYSSNNRWLRFNDKIGYDIRKNYDDAENQIFEIIYPYSRVSSEQYEEEIQIQTESIKNGVHFLYKLNLLRSLAVDSKKTLTRREIFNFVFEDIDPNINTEEFIKLKELVRIHKKISEISTYYDNSTLKPYSIYSIYERSVEDWRFILFDTMFVPNTEEGRNILYQFITQENEFLNEDQNGILRISNYLFPNFFSSGEIAYLSLFSRLHDVIKFYNSEVQQKKYVTIFIDEGDTGFHPKWNKKFFKWVLDFLNKRSEPLKFQLIFSTHSPYLLSDLVSENILLLKRGSENTAEIVSPDDFETFGANIHDLLADSFFLDDGTIGEFARTEINKVIDKLLYWRNIIQGQENLVLVDIPQTERDELYRLISNIGDYIVRGKIFEIYNQVFEDNQIRQQEIDYLEQRLKNLKKNDRN